MRTSIILVCCLGLSACAFASPGQPPPPQDDAGVDPGDGGSVAYPTDVQGLQTTFDVQGGTITLDGADFTVVFSRAAGWRPISYQMKNVPFARGCPGMQLASTAGIVVDPVRFGCNGWTTSGSCSFATGDNTGVDDPKLVEHDGTYASFDATFHAGSGYDVTTTYTVYASGRMVVATSVYVTGATTLPLSLKTGHVEAADDFTGAEPIAGHVAWALMGTCEVLGLGAAVSPTSLLLLGTNEGMVSELHPQAPLTRSIYFDVADTKLNPYARAEAAQNPVFAVYSGGSTLGDGIDLSRGNFIVESSKANKLVMRTAGGAPAFRVDGWGSRPFKVSVAGNPVASTAHPSTVAAFADVSPAGTLTLSLRGEVTATDDIVIE